MTLETPVKIDEPIERLPRVLGPWMATAIIVGVVIGSGIFKKPAQVAETVPETGLALFAWVLCGILTLMGALIIAEIATLYPRAGGVYVFLTEAFGRWAGFLWGWVEFWIIRSASIAALSTMLIEQLHDMVRHLHGMQPNESMFSKEMQVAMTVTLIAVIALVNALGTRLAGMLQLAITTLKVGSLAAIALAPFVVAAWWSAPIVHPETQSQIFWPSDFNLAADSSRFGAALCRNPFRLQTAGSAQAPVAEDIRSPGRNIPIAFIVGVLRGVMLLYGKRRTWRTSSSCRFETRCCI